MFGRVLLTSDEQIRTMEHVLEHVLRSLVLQFSRGQLPTWMHAEQQHMTNWKGLVVMSHMSSQMLRMMASRGLFCQG